MNWKRFSLALSVMVAVATTVLLFNLSEPTTIEMTRLVVTNKPLQIGDQIQPGDLKIVPFPVEHVPNGAIAKPEDVEGMYVVVDLPEESLLFPYILSARPVAANGEVAFPIEIDINTAGLVRGGDRVHVYAIPRRQQDAATSGPGSLSPLLRNIYVMAVLDARGSVMDSQPSSSGGLLRAASDPTSSGVPKVAILAVTPGQADILAHHRQGHTFVLTVQGGGGN